MSLAAARSWAGSSPEATFAEEFLDHASGLVRSDAAEAAEGDALVGGLSASLSRAVVHDEGLGARGLYPNAEAGELVVPGDSGLVLGLESVYGALQGETGLGGELLSASEGTRSCVNTKGEAGAHGSAVATASGAACCA